MAMITVTPRADRQTDIPLAFVELPSLEVESCVHFSNEVLVPARVVQAESSFTRWGEYRFQSAGVINPNNTLELWSTTNHPICPDRPQYYQSSNLLRRSLSGNVGASPCGPGPTFDWHILRGSFWTTGALPVSGNTHARIYAEFGFRYWPIELQFQVPPYTPRRLAVRLTAVGASGGLGSMEWLVLPRVSYEPVPSGYYRLYSPVISLPVGTTGLFLEAELEGAYPEEYVLTRLDLEVGTVATTTGSHTPSRRRLIQKPIVVRRIFEDSSGGWYPVLSDGIVYRTFTMPSGEPVGSWLWNHFSPGDRLVLVYTVPEIHHREGRSQGSPALQLSEIARRVSDRAVRLSFGQVTEIHYLRVGSTVFYPGSRLTPSDPLPPGVRYVDWRRGEIGFEQQLVDEVQVDYTTVDEGYVYTGGNLDRLDLNPSLGRVFTLRAAGGVSVMPTSGLVTSGVAIYLLPVAAYPMSGFPHADTMVRARLTRFVYHRMYSTSEIDWVPWLRSRAYYGFARFDQDQYWDDAFSWQIPILHLADYPSSLVVANLFVDPSFSFRQASVWDVRRRGGGLDERVDPRDPRLGALGQHLWDIGGWNADGVTEGGTLQITLPAGLLANYTRDEIEQIVRKYVAAGVLVNIKFE